MGLMRHFRTNWLWKETKHPIARLAAIGIVAAFITGLAFTAPRGDTYARGVRWPVPMTFVREITIPRIAAVFAVAFLLTLLTCVLLEWSASRFLKKRAERRWYR